MLRLDGALEFWIAAKLPGLVMHDLNHEILERHESPEVESNVIRNTVSFHACTGMSLNLSHRLSFVYFVYFVVNNPDMAVRSTLGDSLDFVMPHVPKKAAGPHSKAPSSRSTPKEDSLA